ncbi:hypothetical protein C7271_11310 [filamentous cyanobacterium CCP5]|nr:hypothetical protein C7271_11310 [filamentous cyanobacterium CCP5]
MFILKRQDVDIKTIAHPKKNQPIPILVYQGQTFRVLKVFTAAQEDEARSMWRDLTDNRGKACVLLEEPDRYSIWGKIRLDQFDDDGDDTSGSSQKSPQTSNPTLVQACLLLLQMLYVDVEDLLGSKQAKLFENDILQVFKEWKFPQAGSPKEVESLLMVDPLAMQQLPTWQEHHLYRLLESMHGIGKDYFGNANFTERALEALEDMNANEQKLFMRWLQQSPAGKLWT